MLSLIIIRGLPGSGKSTIAKELQSYVHVEADMFFVQNGHYNFDPSKLGQAHEWCYSKVMRLLLEGFNVVVSNTFTQKWEMQPYLDLCQELGITPNVIVATGKFQNVHNVSEAVLQRMRDRWED